MTIIIILKKITISSSIELFAHRFASHVCQTLLTLAADVVDQEVAQGGPTSTGNANGEEGELYSMEKLILNICEVIIIILIIMMIFLKKRNDKILIFNIFIFRILNP